jgi:AcrR family transcriptional regulator
MDLRVTKTERAIRKAFDELMRELGFSKLTVSGIIKRAEINRSTFYSHYLDKYNLLEKVEDELLSGVTEIVGKAHSVPLSALQENLTEYLKAIAVFMKENGEMFSLLLSEKGDPAFTDRINKRIFGVLERNNAIRDLSVPYEYAFPAFFGMVSNLIVEWVRRGFKETPDEFVEISGKMTGGVLENITL